MIGGMGVPIKSITQRMYSILHSVNFSIIDLQEIQSSAQSRHSSRTERQEEPDSWAAGGEVKIKPIAKKKSAAITRFLFFMIASFGFLLVQETCPVV